MLRSTLSRAASFGTTCSTPQLPGSVRGLDVICHSIPPASPPHDVTYGDWRYQADVSQEAVINVDINVIVDGWEIRSSSAEQECNAERMMIILQAALEE